ncbi:MAG: TAXI family TRAP transporter solute-binding subunit [Magnetococcales bacterium]|nr:TAXI family TRAP transporter solute-binding subunit [Magnetococcales bacterium]
MFKVLKTGLITALLLALVGCSDSNDETADGEPETKNVRLNIALGKVEGVNYAAGTAVCVALKKSGSELPCKLMASEGSKQNVLAISSGQVDLALVRGDYAFQAWHGKKPFAKRHTNLRVLLSMHHEVATLLVNSNSKILSFSQLADKTINIGSKTSNNGRMVKKLLSNCNIPVGDKFSYEESSKLPELLVKDAVDGGFEWLTHPDEKTKILTGDKPLQFLPITGYCVDQLISEALYLDRVTIPGGIYKGLTSDSPSIGSKVWLVANSDLSEAVIYDVVKAIFSEVEQFRRSDPAFYHLSPRKMLSSFSVPFHIGAVQYFIKEGWYREN